MTTSSKRNREDGTEDWRDQVKDAIIREVENGCPEEEAAPALWLKSADALALAEKRPQIQQSNHGRMQKE